MTTPLLSGYDIVRHDHFPHDMRQLIKVVLFDVDGVVKLGGTFAAALEREHGIRGEQLGPFFREAFGACLVGKGDLLEALAPYLDQWGWQHGAQAFVDFWFQAEHQVDTALLEHVRQLRVRGLRCYLATNQERYRTDYLMHQMGLSLHFDGIFSSANVGWRKPQPEFFHHILQTLHVLPEAALFWDDTPANVEAARALGIHAELYTGLEAFADCMRMYLADLIG